MTGEPVGNGPRRPPAEPKIKGNSHADREGFVEKDKTSAVEPEPAERVVEGIVKVRKAPWYKRAARSMIADDAGSIGDYILIEVIVPTVKNLIRDTIIGSTERTLYGSTRRIGTSSRDSGSSSIRTRYDRMSEGEPRRMMSREAQRRHDFSEVILTSREEAILVVEKLVERVDRYGAASVSDLYDMLGETGSYADRSHGWTDLRDADVRQYRAGWLLDLPQPVPLRR